MSSIFISRKIHPSSVIRHFTDEYGHQLHDVSLIEFTSVGFHLPKTDWLFFYSQQGVKHFFTQIDPSRIKNKKIICFGNKTAESCSRFTDVFASANASVDRALELIDKIPIGDQITFICGAHSLRSVHQKIKDTPVNECIVYSQSLKSVRINNDYDFALLTSPMNVESFFKNEGGAKNYVAIGSTTESALLKYVNKVSLASQPSEEEMLHVVQQLLSI